MKGAVSVTELLDISSKEKHKPEAFEDISVDEDCEFSRQLKSSPFHCEKESTLPSKRPSEGFNSVQGLLMNGKTKRFSEPEIISLDSDGDQCIMMERKVTYPPNSKKTSLKNLFSNFKQPSVTSEKRHSPKTSNEHSASKPFSRFHRISELKELEAPLPSYQLVESPPDIRYRMLDLTQAKLMDYHPPQINSKEYASLRNQMDSVEQPICETMMITEGVKSTKIWSQMNKPETLQQIMLETRMKKAVYKWIEKAFVKLKGHTDRSQLLMKKNGMEGADNLGGFIVEDNGQGDDEPSIEFVPLMILHGDAIGKNTLIEVILQKMNGTIYEINTSNNRSKKDILDNLLEFSTTHYVKGQGSKGIILLDDVDVLFREHDKFFWGAIEKLLWQSRRPVALICRNLSLVPNNLIQIARHEQSIFHAKRVSAGTITNFLTMFCTRNGIVPNDRVLRYISDTTHRDIRKSLLELQFYCQPPGIFTLGCKHEDKDDSISFDDITNYWDILSYSDIISNNCHWKSAVLQDKDLSLLSYESRLILDSISDEQERLRHDYMIDNKIHLFDEKRRPLLPFELNVGDFLQSRLFSHYKGPNLVEKLMDKKFDRMKGTSVAFLSSRITKKDPSVNNITRRTRNSKTLHRMLENFQGNYPQSTVDELISFQFENANRDQLAELINPYVLRIAESDSNKRQINRHLFKQAVSGLPECEHCHAIAGLSREGLLKQPYFESDPKPVIDNWKQ